MGWVRLPGATCLSFVPAAGLGGGRREHRGGSPDDLLGFLLVCETTMRTVPVVVGCRRAAEESQDPSGHAHCCEARTVPGLFLGSWQWTRIVAVGPPAPAVVGQD